MGTTLLPGARRLTLFISTFTTLALLGGQPTFGSPQAGTTAPAAQVEPPVTRALHLEKTTILPSSAPNAFLNGMQCDSEGDIFLQLGHYDYTTAQVEQDGSISEIIPDSKQILAYGKWTLSASDYPNARLTSFSVTPRGVVYGLIFTRRGASGGGTRPGPEYYVEQFKDDGTVGSIEHLDLPVGVTHWFIDQLAAFQSGRLLVAGIDSTNPGQTNASSWRPFTAIYDSTGRFVQDVTLPDDVVNEKADDGKSAHQSPATTAAATSAGAAGAQSLAGGENAQPTAPQGKQSSPVQQPNARESFEVSISTGNVVSAEDGNVWILRASDPLRFYVVSPSGDVIQHFQFSSPAPGVRPFGFGAAGPFVAFLHFVHFADAPVGPLGPSELIGVFDLNSKPFDALYTLPDTLKGLHVLACGDRRGGFLYVGSTPDSHLAIYDYRP